MTDSEMTVELSELALLAAQMIDTCQRIIDAVDERTAVRSWRDELGRDLEWLARWHAEMDR